MEEQTVLKEILRAFQLHADHIDQIIEDKFAAFEQKFDRKLEALEERTDKKIQNLELKMDEKIMKLEEKMEKRIFTLEQKMDNRFDRLEKKYGGYRVDYLAETQETVDYVSSKVTQHERKIRDLQKFTINDPSS